MLFFSENFRRAKRRSPWIVQKCNSNKHFHGKRLINFIALVIWKMNHPHKHYNFFYRNFTEHQHQPYPIDKDHHQTPTNGNQQCLNSWFKNTSKCCCRGLKDPTPPLICRLFRALAGVCSESRIPPPCWFWLIIETKPKLLYLSRAWRKLPSFSLWLLPL